MVYWRIQTKTTIMKTVDNRGFKEVHRVAFQPGQGGRMALATGQGGRLVATGLGKKEIVEFGTDMGGMRELAWSPAGDLLATSSRERKIIWNCLQGNLTINQELQEPVEIKQFILVEAPKFSKDGSFIVLSYTANLTSRQFHQFDVATGALQQSLRIPLVPCIIFDTPLAWKDELEVFCEGVNETINLWRIGQEEPLQTINFTGSSIEGIHLSIKKMAFNPRQNILAFKNDKTVSLWKTTDTPDMAVSVLSHDAYVSEFVWQSDQSDILATIDRFGEVRIWDTTSHTTRNVYNVHLNHTRNIRASVSPNGRFIAVSGDRGDGVISEDVKIVKFDTGDTVGVCEGSGGLRYVAALEWSASGDKLAVDREYLNVFNVDKINFGIKLKGLSMMRVASLLEGNLVNGKEEARNFLIDEITKDLVDDVLSYLI